MAHVSRGHRPSVVRVKRWSSFRSPRMNRCYTMDGESLDSVCLVDASSAQLFGTIDSVHQSAKSSPLNRLGISYLVCSVYLFRQNRFGESVRCINPSSFSSKSARYISFSHVWYISSACTFGISTSAQLFRQIGSVYQSASYLPR